MQLSALQIQKYKELYHKEFGLNLSDSEAREQGLKLINLIKLTYKPITKKQLNKLNKNSYGISRNNKN